MTKEQVWLSDYAHMLQKLISNPKIGGAEWEAANARLTEVVLYLRQVEPPAPQKFCVYVQKNVIGLGSFLEYPKNIELVPFGPVFDTEDAARLFGAKHGWMDIWWNVQPVNRGGSTT